MQQRLFEETSTEEQSNQTKPSEAAAAVSGSASAVKAPDQDFESMIAELEKIVGQLDGELKLEEALTLFERGLGLSQQCEKFLKGAEQKIEILKRTASGAQTEPFEADD